MITRSEGQSATPHRKPLSRFIRVIAVAMVISALGRELSKPAAERTWQGKVWQVVPYDFRVPTWARVRERMWAPDRPSLFSPQVFGVGWTVNVGRMYTMLTAAIRSDRPAS